MRQILALRFSEECGISVIEFLEFFGSSVASRRTKSAHAAVRISMNRLAVEDDGEMVGQKSENPSRLEVVGDRFHKMFPAIEADLTAEFQRNAQPDTNIISSDVFKVR